MNIYFRIVYMFFATGLFSIGGGLATLPFLYDMSTRTNWFTHHDIANMLAVSQSVPGAVGINISTFAGFHTAGIPGALLAALSLITPGLIIILFIARFLDAFHENRIVNSAFYGLRAASLGLIASVAVGIAIPIFINMDLRSTDSMLIESMYNILNLKAIVLASMISAVLFIKKNTHPIFIILFAAVSGIILKM